MLFTELPPPARPAAARAAGFELVETWWPDDPEAWSRAVRSAGVGVACLNAEAGSIAAGDRGFLNVPERADASLDAVQRALDLAREVGAPGVNVLAGRALPGVPERRQRETALAVLREAAGLAAAAGVAILLEPINLIDVPGYLFP